MLDGVAKWKYVNEDSDDEQVGEGSGAGEVDEKPVSLSPSNCLVIINSPMAGYT